MKCFRTDQLNNLVSVLLERGASIDPKGNALTSAVAGFLFFTGWWLMIDAAAVYPNNIPITAHICSVTATVSLIMVNSVSNAQLQGYKYTGGCLGRPGMVLWLFFGFVLGFASLIGACGIIIIYQTKYATEMHAWPVICLFLQNGLILASSLVLKFYRNEDEWA